MMQVSVIIPVYQAERFLKEAVASALAQPETAEVLLVEDGSPDRSPDICRELEASEARVRLLSHDDRQNHGAGAARNLGIRHAQCPFIAFLDADDLYLPGRFTHAAEVLGDHADADGVYETTGVTYEDILLRSKHLERTHREHTGLTRNIAPEHLFRALAHGKYGHLHLNGVVLRREAITEDLLFDTALRQCQDSDWFLRLSARRRLYGGKTDVPVAVRRVHADNRVFHAHDRIFYQRAFLRKCISNNFYGSGDRYANAYLIARYVSWLVHGRLRRAGLFSRPFIVIASAGYLISHPAVLFRLLFAAKS